MDKDVADAAVILDQSNHQAIVGKLNDPFFLENADKIGALLFGNVLEGVEGECKEISDLIDHKDVIFLGDIAPEIREIFVEHKFDIKIFTEDEWNTRIEQVYMAMLGIRVEIVRHKSLNASNRESKDSGINPLKFNVTHVVAKGSNINLKNVGLINLVILPQIRARGKLLAVLRGLEKALVEKREDLKEEERQSRNDKILALVIRGRELLFQRSKSDLKKEKIWFENTTSFLRYLMRKDRKLLLFKNI